MTYENDDLDNDNETNFDFDFGFDNLDDLNDNQEEDEEYDDNDEKKIIKKTNNKPKLVGKHSLTYDTIFKGKKTDIDQQYESEHIIKNAGGSLDINDDSLNFEESRSNIDYFRDTRLKKEIHNILLNNTDIDFNSPRRKPSKSDFNAYFKMIIKELHQYGYNKTDIFIELSEYFSDNVWNIFLLLENKYSNIIINELKDKHGLSDIDKIDFL